MHDANFETLQQSWVSTHRDLRQCIGAIDRALALACQQVSDPTVLVSLQLAQGASATLAGEVDRQEAVAQRLQPIESQALAFMQALGAKRQIARIAKAAQSGAPADAAQEVADLEAVAKEACRVMLQEIATPSR